MKKLTLSEMMTEWNPRPEAAKLGLKVRVHTSPFESRAVGERRLAWLNEAMAAAAPKRRRR
jgi:hypothetical protein